MKKVLNVGGLSHWLASVVCWRVVLLALRVAGEEPAKLEGQPWRILSFAKDAHLEGKNIFQIDFQAGKSPSTLEKV